MGKVITGRYGSVQRLLQIGTNSDGTTKWSTIDPNIRQGDWQSKDGQGSFVQEVDPATLLLDSYAYGHSDDIASTVSAVTSWSLENTVAPISYIASNTRGYNGQLEGTHSATGNISGLGALPPIAPGQRFKFFGYVGPDNGALDNYAGVVYSITAIATSVQLQINYQLTNPITWTVGWQSDWQEEGDELHGNTSQFLIDKELLFADKNGSYPGFWDYTKMQCEGLMPSTSCNLAFTDTEKEVCLLDANIQFQTDAQTYTNSCSAKMGGWQSSVVGATRCTVSANIHGDNYSDLCSLAYITDRYGEEDTDMNRRFWPGTNHTTRIYLASYGIGKDECDKSAYWEFEKLFFGTFGGLNVDTTSNNPVQFSCSMEFNAFPDCKPGYILYQAAEPETGERPAPAYLVDLRPESSKPSDGGSAYEYDSNTGGLKERTV